MKNFLIFVFLILFFQICIVSLKKPRKRHIRTTKCKYTFVVREADTTTVCPSYFPHFQADVQNSNTNTETNVNPQGMKVIENRLKNVEQQLGGEIEKNLKLNDTIAKQELSLRKADELLQEYRSNFSNIFRLINHLERNLHKQKHMYRDLEKKVSSIGLDVVEVSNVLAKKVSPNDEKLKEKQVEVESVSKNNNCGLTNEEAIFRDCYEVYQRGHKTSGVYFITPIYSSCSIPVWCDMETPPGGWLVIQRRQDGQESFNRYWVEYRHGFGQVASEFWLGLDNIFLLTSQDHYEMRVDLWDFNDNRVYALYKNFKIDGERDKYRIHAHNFEGSVRDGLKKHNGMMFSTPDQDNDNFPNYHCAREWYAGWWYDNCWFVLLNGKYYNRSTVPNRGIAWNDWRPQQLRRTEMKIRPSRLYLNNTINRK